MTGVQTCALPIYRYIKGTSLNCTYNYCEGFALRNKFGIAFIVAGGEQKEWFLRPEYEMMLASVSNTTLPMADEQEVILANPGNDTLDRYTVTFGKKVEHQIYGAALRQASYRTSGQRNESQVVFLRTNWRDTAFTIGGGRYASDQNVAGFTMFMAYEWQFGNSLSLF